MISLGIESTAHSFGIGIMDDKGRCHANMIDMYKAPVGWGIHPMEAAKHHEEVHDRLLLEAFRKSGLDWKDVDIISFSQGPGLPPCLNVGLRIAQGYAKEHKKPLVPVNHCIAHVEIGRQCTGSTDPVVLYVSGANTQVLSFVEHKYRCFGETQDIGIGNALDKFGRGTGLAFPAGPKIEAAAAGGKWIDLPYSVKGMDLSFSGIVTEAVRRHERGVSDRDLCFSMQETCFAMLTEVTERALAHTNKEEVLLTGGVAANSRLQEMISIMAKERGAKYWVVPREFSGDNGAMIAWTGLLIKKAGRPNGDIHQANTQSPKRYKQERELAIKPRQRTDEVDVTWM
jgi:N6-L-threonylcarbamoyladenine synthase/N6-L-threonylcarbamoyladenine synthase/protein kinase Bud32